MANEEERQDVDAGCGLIIVAVVVLGLVIAGVSGCGSHALARLDFGCNLRIESEESKTQFESLQDGDGKDGRVAPYWSRPGASGRHVRPCD